MLRFLVNSLEVTSVLKDSQHNFFLRINGVWLINPSMVIKGNRSKEKVLMDKFILIQRKYDEKRKARKNSKRKEADKEKAAA